MGIRDFINQAKHKFNTDDDDFVAISFRGISSRVQDISKTTIDIEKKVNESNIQVGKISSVASNVESHIKDINTKIDDIPKKSSIVELTLVNKAQLEEVTKIKNELKENFTSKTLFFKNNDDKDETEKLKSLFEIYSLITVVLYSAALFLTAKVNITNSIERIFKGFSTSLLFAGSAFLLMTIILVVLIAFNSSKSTSSRTFISNIVWDINSKITAYVAKYLLVLLGTVFLIFSFAFVGSYNKYAMPLFAVIVGIIVTFIIIHIVLKNSEISKSKTVSNQSCIVKLSSIIIYLVYAYLFLFSFFIICNISLYMVPHVDVKLDKDLYSSIDSANIIIFSKGPAVVEWINVTYSNLNIPLNYTHSPNFTGAPIYVTIDNLTPEPYNSFITINYRILNSLPVLFLPKLNNLTDVLSKIEFIPVIPSQKSEVNVSIININASSVNIQTQNLSVITNSTNIYNSSEE